MPDQKVSALNHMTTWSANDLLLVIDVGTTNVSKIATLKEFAENALANTAINGTFAVSGNTVFEGTSLYQQVVTANAAVTFTRSVTVANTKIKVANTFTPASADIDIGGVGTICWDENFIYVQVAANTVKRAALNSWS